MANKYHLFNSINQLNMCNITLTKAILQSIFICISKQYNVLLNLYKSIASISSVSKWQLIIQAPNYWSFFIVIIYTYFSYKSTNLNVFQVKLFA